MARTQSSGSTAEACQTAVKNGQRPSATGTVLKTSNTAFMLPAQLVWGMRLISGLQLAIIIQLWPSATSTPTSLVLVTSATILIALSTIIRPVTAHHSNQTHRSDPAPTIVQPLKLNEQAHHISLGAPPTTANNVSLHQTPSRRNPPPVREVVAPRAAPNAVLPKNLNEQQEAWADLLARMSHDLRTPLNAVIGFSDLMQREAFGPLGSPRYQEYARHIQDCSVALLKSAEDTLAMTSAITNKSDESLELIPVPVATLANYARQRLMTKVDLNDIVIEIDIDPNLEINCERLAMRQVVLNLLDEALAHTKSGGNIVIRTSTTATHVILEIGTTTCKKSMTHDTLPICIARTLLQLHNTAPTFNNDDGTCWIVTTKLERATQHDFFESSDSSKQREATETELEKCAA